MIKKELQDRIDAWFLKDYKETFMERIQLVFEAEKLYAEEEAGLAYGHTLQHILNGVSVPIQETELLAGSVLTRIPTEEEEQEIWKVYKRWWDIPTEERHKKILFYYSENWLRCRPYWFPSFGHLAMDWEKVLKEGLDGLAKTARERKEDPALTSDQKYFLEGVLLCYEAISTYIERYAKAAAEAGKEAQAADLRQIARGGAQSFSQALQLIWMLVLVLQKVCGCGVLNLSRMDQYLSPYYEKDLEEGVLTEAQALDLLEEFYFKNNEIMVQTDHMSIETQSTDYTLEVAFDDPNYLILAGKNADGTGGVNRLSYAMIEAARDLKLRNPFIVVRYYKGIPEDYWRLVCKAMRENATVVIYNDETMIPALKYYGVEEPEVYDYGFFGCNDPNIPADEGGLRQVWVNMAKPLELALQRGDYPMDPKAGKPERDCEFDIDDRMTGLMTGAYYGLETKDLDEIKTMEEFVEVYQEQLTYLMGEFRKGFEMDFEVEKQVTGSRMRIEDCFLRGTIENAVTWTRGGTKYHKIVTQGSGMATVIDAMYAIDKLVFQDHEYTLKELAQIMKDDYAGNEFLSMRLKKKIDKFGNDKDEVDRYAKIVTDCFVKAVDAYNGDQYLYQMWPTYSTDRDFTTMGRYVGATPDGRRAKEQLSENQSPAEGSDINGLTAMLNSVAKIPFNRITGGPLNLRIHPSAVKGEDGLDAMCALFKTYMEEGGLQLQVNVIDAETLRAAQENPDKYRSLCVRVTGYSAFFVEMGKKAQEELIHRTEQLI
ncbi:MAG: pyruvate formate lyase family protein [Blautia sp.]|jgi:pyruvate-formate lyase